MILVTAADKAPVLKDDTIETPFGQKIVVLGGVKPSKKLPSGLVLIKHPPDLTGKQRVDYHLPSGAGLYWSSIDDWQKSAGATEEQVAELEHLLGLNPYRLRSEW